MTQDELKLVLDALKWCHGGEPCGTAEAIAVVEKALAQHDSVQAKPEPEQEPVAIMREMLEVQGQHGNWNYDSYMHGLYNGMEYMVALAEKREPQFRDAPEMWLTKYEVKRNNFNNTEPLTEATPPQRQWVGLTEDERTAIRAGVQTYLDMTQYEYGKTVQQATELKLQEKNT